MKTQEQRINNIIGQLNGIKKMIDQDKNCFEVIIQMKAAKSALATLMDKFIEINFINCVSNSCANRESYEKLNRLIKELAKK